jgi:hypothetical protein
MQSLSILGEEILLLLSGDKNFWVYCRDGTFLSLPLGVIYFFDEGDCLKDMGVDDYFFDLPSSLFDDDLLPTIGDIAILLALSDA